MTEYFVRQFDGGPKACDGRNCAAASGAMAVAYGSAGEDTPTSDEFRDRSGVSCIPDVHSPSGGLFISDVERTCASYGVHIDYGRMPSKPAPARWPATTIKAKLRTGYGCVALGDYDQLGSWAASSFKGDHSAWAHDFRESDQTVCFHDPLRKAPIRLPWKVFVDYNQKPGSPVRGLAGFVLIPSEEWEAVIHPRPGDPDGKQPFLVYRVFDHDERPLRIVSHAATRTAGSTYRVKPPVKAARGPGFPKDAYLPKGLCRLIDAVPHLPPGGYLDVALASKENA